MSNSQGENNTHLTVMKQTKPKTLTAIGRWGAIAALSLLSFSSTALAQFDFESPTPSSGPSFAQLGSTQAYVPMEHETFSSNGNEFTRHVLATTAGNLDMKGQVEMKCPAGRTVTYLAYIPQGQNLRWLVDSDTNQQTYTRTVTFQPFSIDDFEAEGQELLGGVWHGSQGHPPLRSATVRKTLKKNVEVRGRCSGWTNDQTKTFPVTLTMTFEDLDFPPPPEG